MTGTNKPCGMLYSICMSIAQETVICRNRHSSSNWYSRIIIRQLGYRHNFCQNVVSSKNIPSPYIFVKK